MFVKNLFLFFYLLLLTGCHHLFDNIVDPHSKSYIGYPVAIGKNKTIPLSPKEGETIFFPAFEWLKASSPSSYFIQISKSKNWQNTIPLFEKNYLVDPFFGMLRYQENEEWFFSKEDQKLALLPYGTYYWRVSLKNADTKEQLGPWSQTYSFNIEMRLKEIYWKYDPLAPNGVKQGFAFFPDQKRGWEREYSFIKINGIETINYSDLQLNQYNEVGEILLKKVYRGVEPSEKDFYQQFQFLYDLDQKGKKIRTKKIMVADNKIFLSKPKLMEENEFFYEKSAPFFLLKMNTYRYNEDTGEKKLYSVTEWENGLQKKTSFIKKNNQTQEDEVIYFYTLDYFSEHPEKVKLAKYYLKNKESGEFVFYNDYIFEYNFPDEEKEDSFVIERGKKTSVSFSSFLVLEEEMVAPVAIE